MRDEDAPRAVGAAPGPWPTTLTRGGLRALTSTGYSAKRLEEGAAAATVNRELSALKRAFSSAVKGERLQRIPYIAMLRENNVHTGFVEPPPLEAIQHPRPAGSSATVNAES
jgi:hypothetical protein